MLAPALPDIQKEFGITSDFDAYLIMSIFLLAYAIGPFLLAPLSEMYGRVVVLQSANMVYLIFNTVAGFAQTREQLLVFRFLSGIGGSAPQAVCFCGSFWCVCARVSKANGSFSSAEAFSVTAGGARSAARRRPSTALRLSSVRL